MCRVVILSHLKCPPTNPQGRYLIKSVRHKVSTVDDYHSMNMECIKDAVKDPYPQENLDTLSTRENTDRINVLQYELDDTILIDGGEV